MAAAGAVSDLLERARSWAESDPDPHSRAEVEEMIARGDHAALAASFDGALTFGTAGIRGQVGPGPARMNRAVVIRVTAGLVAYLGDTGGRPVVVAFDARPTSGQFAKDTAGVLVASGIPVVYFTGATPTPLAAYTAKVLGAAAAVVITASHNPPQDNGYKVYDANAAQIVPPVDTDIAGRIADAPAADRVPRLEDPSTSNLLTTAPSDIVDRYRADVEAARPQPVGSNLRIVYTPMHGCGGDTVSALLSGAGHIGLIAVSEQYEPDGTFPTVGFPNPEEPGALDLALATARRKSADLVIANDPDADRLAAVVPLAGEWRALSGNDLGVLLGDAVLSAYSPADRPIVISSVVSSPMLGDLARSRGARHVSTLTGFKWIVNAGLHLEAAGEGRFVYGYEEALGYTIGSVVRDKDGMSAALVFCDLVETLRRSGMTVWDRLAELWREAGLWASAQQSVMVAGPEGLAAMQAAVDRLAGAPPSEVDGMVVTKVVDYRLGAQERPFWLGEQDLIELVFGGTGRALVRPSGTEPKLKIYVDLRAEAGRHTVADQEVLGERARRVASALSDRVIA